MTDQLKSPPTLDELRAHRDEIIALAERYGAYNIRVFGSVARGEASSDSDVDLLVDFKPHSLLDRLVLMDELRNLLGHNVDLVQEKSLRPHVRPTALEDAIPL